MTTNRKNFAFRRIQTDAILIVRIQHFPTRIRLQTIGVDTSENEPLTDLSDHMLDHMPSRSGERGAACCVSGDKRNKKKALCTQCRCSWRRQLCSDRTADGSWLHLRLYSESCLLLLDLVRSQLPSDMRLQTSLPPSAKGIYAKCVKNNIAIIVLQLDRQIRLRYVRLI